ncbi:MAG: nitroreductase family protein [Anaerolineae bacterium]|nr:nitroreductase family protein [Anaerolineae bacterium]
MTDQQSEYVVRALSRAEPVLRALRGRRSVRAFREEPVPRELIESILEAATWAPSASNLQPWRFVVLQGQRKAELVDLLHRFAAGLQPGLNPILWVHRRGLGRCAGIIEGASVAILAWAIVGPEDQRLRLVARGDLTPLFSWTMVVQSVAAAVQNLLLAAHALGLGAVWLGYPSLAGPEIARWLKEEGELMATVALGYPAAEPGQGRRKPLAQVARWEG